MSSINLALLSPPLSEEPFFTLGVDLTGSSPNYHFANKEIPADRHSVSLTGAYWYPFNTYLTLRLGLDVGVVHEESKLKTGSSPDSGEIPPLLDDEGNVIVGPQPIGATPTHFGGTMDGLQGTLEAAGLYTPTDYFYLGGGLRSSMLWGEADLKIPTSGNYPYAELSHRTEKTVRAFAEVGLFANPMIVSLKLAHPLLEGWESDVSYKGRPSTSPPVASLTKGLDANLEFTLNFNFNLSGEAEPTLPTYTPIAPPASSPASLPNMEEEKPPVEKKATPKTPKKSPKKPPLTEAP